VASVLQPRPKPPHRRQYLPQKNKRGSGREFAPQDVVDLLGIGLAA
jgi:hypothetical protein